MSDMVVINLRPVSNDVLPDEKLYIELYHFDFNRAVRDAIRLAKMSYRQSPFFRTDVDFEVVSIQVV